LLNGDGNYTLMIESSVLFKKRRSRTNLKIAIETFQIVL